MFQEGTTAGRTCCRTVRKPRQGVFKILLILAFLVEFSNSSLGQQPYGLLIGRGETASGWGAGAPQAEYLPDLGVTPDMATMDAPPAAAALGVAAGVGAPLTMVVGDTGGFAAGTLRFGDNEATLQNSLLNIAENGTVMPTDRFFAEWRHFDDMIKTDVFSTPDFDNSATLGVDRVTLGMEKKYLDGLFSIEVRLPFRGSLDYDINVRQETATPANPYPNVTGVPLSSERFSLGNVGVILKSVLYRNQIWGFTSGVGLKLPTARDTTFRLRIDDDEFRIYDAPGSYTTVDMDLEMAAMVANETPDLLPFFAVAYTPNDRFFSQLFLQLDVPLNRTRGVIGIDGSIEGIPIGHYDLAAGTITQGGVAGHQTLGWQTLMRVNTQFGYWIYKNPNRRLHSIATLLEFHWATTLTDAEIARETILSAQDLLLMGVGSEPLELTLGNEANRVDIVNVVFATAFEVGSTEITPAFTVPLSTGDNKPFDWECSLLINQRF